ncbi:MAG: hypothetical protein GY814_12150, partial [Gammaproteobacteria bacterium]|nr:hypothetical protein [Gammaproteobacteria bacterium]
MDTKYIGTGGDFLEFELWCAYYLGLGTLTEDVECIFTDDDVYAHSDRAAMNFTALTPGVFQTLIRAADDVKHTGDFGVGPRIISTQGSYIYEPRTNGDPEQFTIQDLSFENHQGNGGGLGSLGGVTLNRVIISTTIGQINRAAFYHLSSRGGLVLNACRAHSLSGGAWGYGFDLNQNGGYKIDAVNCTATGFAIGVRLDGTSDIYNGRFKNIVTYDCPLGFSDIGGNGWEDASNLASDDGTHPGDDGVLITADPFEADGYTPSQGSQLDAAGIDAGVILGADGKPFAIVPAIGAYQTYVPFDDVAPILTNPTSEGHFQGMLCKVDTDEDNGGIYGVSTDTATKPEPEQVEAGQDHLGATANDSQSGAVTATGSQS